MTVKSITVPAVSLDVLKAIGNALCLASNEFGEGKHDNAAHAWLEAVEEAVTALSPINPPSQPDNPDLLIKQSASR